MSKNVNINVNHPLFHKSRGARVRKAIANIVLGLAIIAVGIGYIGNYLDFLPWSGFTVFFPGWGALLLIVPAIYWIIRRPLSWFWPVCLLIGVLILLAKQEQYSFGTAAAITLAVGVVLVGIRIILAPVFKHIRRKRRQNKWGRKWEQKIGTGTTFSSIQSGSDPAGDYSVNLGDRIVNIQDEEFTSATISCHLGNLEFNISRAIITDCAVIDATCSMGNLEIYLPSHVRTEVVSTFSLGNFENHHMAPPESDAPVVYINLDGSCGNVEIH